MITRVLPNALAADAIPAGNIPQAQDARCKSRTTSCPAVQKVMFFNSFGDANKTFVSPYVLVRRPSQEQCGTNSSCRTERHVSLRFPPLSLFMCCIANVGSSSAFLPVVNMSTCALIFLRPFRVSLSFVLVLFFRVSPLTDMLDTVTEWTNLRWQRT